MSHNKLRFTSYLPELLHLRCVFLYLIYWFGHWAHAFFFSFHPYCLQIHFSCVCDHTSYGQEQLNWCFFNYCRFASAAMKFACNYMRRSCWLIHHIYIYMGLYCARFNAALFNRLQNLLKFCNISLFNCRLKENELNARQLSVLSVSTLFLLFRASYWR
jgi:hypothetical protein